MKEAYFQQDSLPSLTQRWLEEYARPSKGLRQTFEVQSACLLILDMQRYFLDENSHAWIPSGSTILPGLKKIRDFFREAGRPVIASQHVNTPENARNMGTWWSELITGDHPLGEIVPDLEILPQEILTKTQYDAFFDSDLEFRLREAGIKQIVIGGVMTHLCCESTARAAFVRGFEVFFLIDGTATYNRQYHQAALLNLAHGVAVLTTIDQIVGE
jgi:isochorismate hydrolase